MFIEIAGDSDVEEDCEEAADEGNSVDGNF